MAIAFFPNIGDADVIEVALATTQGQDLSFHLLVDSGFTGSSSFVLPLSIGNLAIKPALPGYAFGAIQGLQPRAIVKCRIPAISFLEDAIAILADLGPMGLPVGVQGMVGLQFLRKFRRWGAEKMDDGSWRFFLETA